MPWKSAASLLFFVGFVPLLVTWAIHDGLAIVEEIMKEKLR